MATERKSAKTTPRLKRSKKSNLFVHRNGTYYARVQANGKGREKSLGTKDYNLAAELLDATVKELQGASQAHKAGSLAEAMQAEVDRNDPTIKPKTRLYYRETAKSILKVMQEDEDLLKMGLAKKPLPRVSIGDLKKWQDVYASKVSVSRHNGALTLLRRVWTHAIDNKMAATSPAAALKRLKPDDRDFTPPTREEFAALVASIREQGKRFSEATAAAVEFLAYTGLRISEAQDVTWGRIRNGRLVRRVAKNNKIITTPLIPAAQDLLERIKASGIAHGPDDPVMLVRSPRMALAAACERLGMDHLRVHDLRHIFATRCLESGVDFLTLASWLGHKD